MVLRACAGLARAREWDRARARAPLETTVEEVRVRAGADGVRGELEAEAQPGLVKRKLFAVTCGDDPSDMHV